MNGKQSNIFLIKAMGEIRLVIFVTSLLLAACKEKQPAPFPSSPAATIAKQPLIIELVTADSVADDEKMKAVLSSNGLSSDTIYRWKNHFVLFDTVNDSRRLAENLKHAYPGSQVKIYDSAFYSFNRKHCQDSSQVAQWGHVILTANLVEDTSLQQEYLDHHASQFEKWPEVSAGFCRAGFQQLLVFKNGRQLMLVISIPRGKTLQELDPKTTENNPRVVEWNTLMKKYQEGIPGTRKEEVWVFLDPVLLNKKN